MAKDKEPVLWGIRYYNSVGHEIAYQERSIKGEVNNGVVKGLAKQDGIRYYYWKKQRIKEEENVERS